MLGLKLPTDPRWVRIVEKNIEEILTDHAYCEQKAASTAISLIVSFPEYPELVEEMIALAKEEISHFKMVHDKIVERGWTLGRDRKDEYVLALLKFFPKGGSRTTQMVHRLLYAALIEASGGSLSFIWTKHYCVALSAYPPASGEQPSGTGLHGIAPHRVYMISLQHYLYILSVALVLPR